MSTKCYDVSFYQKGLEIPEDTHHVIIRLGQKDYMDTECENFIQQCINKGIHFDFYWYIDTAEIELLRKEFEFINNYFNLLCEKYGFSHNKHLWLDFEKEGQDNKLFFMRALKYGQDYSLNVGVYTCWDWYRRVMQNQTAFKDTPLWLAWWGVPNDWVMDIPNIHFHQYGTTKIGNYTVDGDTELFCCEYMDADKEHETNPETFKGVKLYSSAYSQTPVTTISGKFYYYDNEIINGRRRVTTDSFYVGKEPLEKYVTGWIDFVEPHYTEKDSFTAIYTNLFASAYDVLPVGKTDINKTYYYYDNEIINGKRRVTVDKEHIGDKNYGKYVTGWVTA